MKKQIKTDSYSLAESDNHKQVSGLRVILPRPGSRRPPQASLADNEPEKSATAHLPVQQESSQSSNSAPIDMQIVQTEEPVGPQLTPEERVELDEHETKVKLGVASVGASLQVIREKSLYREQFATFEDYVETRWNYSRSRAYQLIEFASVHWLLRDVQEAATLNERQIRELNGLSAEHMVRVLAKAKIDTGNKQLTASKIKAARQALFPKTEPTEQAALPKQAESAQEPTITGDEEAQYNDRVESCIAWLDEQLAGCEPQMRPKLLDAVRQWLRKSKQPLKSA